MLFHFRRLNIFRPEKLFESSVSFGADIQFNERKTEYDSLIEKLNATKKL